MDIHRLRLLFHPVGQGLFASGRLSNTTSSGSSFNWVYDCGSASSGGLDKACIRKLAVDLGGSRPWLDLLVLSHFDHDHISGVVSLLTEFRVRNLVIPLIPLWQRLALAFDADQYISKAEWPFYLNPVEAITSIPGAEIVRVIAVPPSRGDGPAPDGDNRTVALGPANPDRPDDILERSSGLLQEWELMTTLPDGFGIGSKHCDLGTHSHVSVLRPGATLSVGDIWEFVPYNDASAFKPGAYRFTAQAEAWRHRLVSSQEVTDRKIVLGRLKKLYEHRYKNSKERNLISLFLYAGQGARVAHWECACALAHSGLCGERADWYHMESHQRRMSVVYTGDGFLNTKSRWRALRDHLGPSRLAPLAFQVMHHGAQANWYRGLAQEIDPQISIFSSDPLHRRFKHPHLPVVRDFQSVSTTSQADRFLGVLLEAYLIGM